MATVNDLKAELTARKIPFPADALKEVLEQLLAETPDQPITPDATDPQTDESDLSSESPDQDDATDTDSELNESDSETDGQPSEDTTETDTHYLGENGRWYRKKPKPLLHASLHHCNTEARKVAAALKVQAIRARIKEDKAFLKANKHLLED